MYECKEKRVLKRRERTEETKEEGGLWGRKERGKGRGGEGRGEKRGKRGEKRKKGRRER